MGATHRTDVNIEHIREGIAFHKVKTPHLNRDVSTFGISTHRKRGFQSTKRPADSSICSLVAGAAA